jgi:hypothetical protein
MSNQKVFELRENSFAYHMSIQGEYLDEVTGLKAKEKTPVRKKSRPGSRL